MLKIITATEAKLLYNVLTDAQEMADEYSEEWLVQDCADALEILSKLREETAEDVIK